jgi:hypothetical protein
VLKSRQTGKFLGPIKKGPFDERGIACRELIRFLSRFGDANSPNPELCTQADRLVSHGREITDRLADLVCETPVLHVSGDPESVVQHTYRPIVHIIQIVLRDPTEPASSHIFFVTDFPDGYYLYDARMEDISPVAVCYDMW